MAPVKALWLHLNAPRSPRIAVPLSRYTLWFQWLFNNQESRISVSFLFNQPALFFYINVLLTLLFLTTFAVIVTVDLSHSHTQLLFFTRSTLLLFITFTIVIYHICNHSLTEIIPVSLRHFILFHVSDMIIARTL